MKKAYIIIAAACLLAALPVRAQLTSTMTSLTHDSTFAQGRDFYFAMQSNYWGIDLSGKYMRIYITSNQNCTAFVASQFSGGVAGIRVPVPVTAYEISSFKIPEFWEMESSGIPENKVIEVYSNTADLTVYDMSHNPYTSDGSYIIPTIGWGTDYVVAAYGSLYEGGGNYVYDLPSTCMVVANQDGTTFSFTPSCNCRNSASGNDMGDPYSTIVVFFADSTYSFTINRGQCVQFMPVKAQNGSDFDMTGTIIHANKPVGVEGGSVCPNIPGDYPYCDHVEDMIPPVRTWGETYYTTNPIQPPGETDKDFADYLFIASKAGQTILRQQCDSSTKTECIIPNKYGIYWDELPGPEKFTSDAPFLVVQYLNGATYPDGNNGLGDPAEAIVMPREQYTRSVLTEVPLSVGNIVPYDDYAQVIVNVKDENKTTFDGKGIRGFGSQCLDSNWEIFTMPHIAPQPHLITGDDSGVGVWIYGYGYDESYAWSAPAQCKTFQSNDSVAPRATVTTECLESFIHLTDTGALASGLDMIRLNSAYNMNYQVDPNWIEGSEVDTGGYSLYVVNPSQPGILIVSVFDVAGNRTTITSVYAPVVDSIKPPLQSLGTWVSGPPKVAYDTLYNKGQDAFDITELHLLKGNVGFSLFDSIGGPLNMSPVQPGQRRLIQIQFKAIDSAIVTDSIIFGDSCFTQSAALIGSGGAVDFYVSSQSWPDELLTVLPTCYPKTVTIYNFSPDTLTIDKAFWKDILHFQAVSTFPVVIPPVPASKKFTINYCPDLNSIGGEDATQGSWTSPQVLEGTIESPQFDSLTGSVVTATEAVSDDTVIADTCPANDTITAFFTITATGTGNTLIASVTQSDPTDFFNLVGTLDNGLTWNPATNSVTLSPEESATISVQYVVPAGVDKTVTDHLIAIDGYGDTIGHRPLTVTVNGVYFDGASSPTSLIFGSVNFQANDPGNNQKSFLISNASTTSPLSVYSIGFQPGNYNAAFTLSLSSVPGNIPELFPTDSTPILLQVGQSVSVNIDFNDSLFDVAAQQALFDIQTNSCNSISEILTAFISNAGVQEASAPSLNATILPAADGQSLEIILPAQVIGPASFQLMNVLGESVLRSTFSVRTQTVDASALPRGVYFYRLTSGQMSQSGKIILGE